MFPPKPSEKAEEWVGSLWESLQRAAPQWDSEATYEELDDGRVMITLFLLDPLNKELRGVVGRIIRDYARASTWKVEKILLEKNYVLFVVSRA